MASQSSRRAALGRATTWAASAMVFPSILTNRARGSNDRIGIGMIGVRNQGSGNLKRFQKAGADIVAICDVDSLVAAEAVQLVDGPSPRVFSDYRKLLEMPQVDAVVINVPDHWHALMTIDACRAGKDVYCEKPLSLTIAEGRRMADAARKNERVVQTGSQQRSSEEFWQACMLVRNGWIGQVHEVQVGISGPNHPGPLDTNTDPPAELNYDMWLGPAPYRPYNAKRLHYNFRFWWDYSGGQMTNWGAHHLDIAQWGLGTDETGPISVEGTATFHPQMVHEVTESARLTFTYANGARLLCGQGQRDLAKGTRFLGSQGEVFVNRGKLITTPVELASLPLENLTAKDLPSGRAPVQLYRSTDHTLNFLQCMRDRSRPVCDVEIGHRSATVCHLGNIVSRLGRRVRWDPVAEVIIDDDQAQSMVDRPYRHPYSHDL